MRNRIQTTLHLNGIERATALLNQLAPDLRESLMASMAEENPELAQQIQQLMLTFEHLSALDDRSLQVLMKEVDGALLLKALRGVSAETLEAFLGNVSQRKRVIMLDDMDAMGPQRRSDVFAAQQEILKTVLLLADRGKLSLPGDDEWVG